MTPLDVSDPGPVPRGSGWVEAVNTPLFESEVGAIRNCVQRNAPFGSERWVRQTATALGLGSSLTERGNPRLKAGNRVNT